VRAETVIIRILFINTDFQREGIANPTLLNARQSQPAQAQGQRTIQATEGNTVPV
jgi:hypothetical protein